nr:MAG TPA: hypothetical protein [Caudoviricetes sp.]
MYCCIFLTSMFASYMNIFHMSIRFYEFSSYFFEIY